MIATVTFDRTDEPPDWTAIDIVGLQEVVMTALDRHFGGYGRAAEAQQNYRHVRADIDASSATLFGAAEALRAGLAAHPEAKQWDAFEQAAAAGIAPFRFSIRFTE